MTEIYIHSFPQELGRLIPKKRLEALAGLWGVFGKVSGPTLVPSAFFDRLPSLAKILKMLLGKVLEKTEVLSRQPLGTLAAFQKVVATDS